MDHSTCLARNMDVSLQGEPLEDTARSTRLRLQIMSTFGSRTMFQPGQPDVGEQLRSASVSRLSDAQALHIVPGDSWSAYTARRLLTRCTPAMTGAAGQLYAEPPLQHFRQAYAMEQVGEAQHNINQQEARTGNMPSAKRRKTTGGKPSLSARSTCATTVATPDASTALHVTLSVGSLVWAQCRGFPFWPGRVAAVTATSLRVDFFGDETSQSFRNMSSAVLPFHHERAQEFVQAGCTQHDEGLRAKFLAGHRDALQAKRQELQPTPRSIRGTAEVCRPLHCDFGVQSADVQCPAVFHLHVLFLSLAALARSQHLLLTCRHNGTPLQLR